MKELLKSLRGLRIKIHTKTFLTVLMLTCSFCAAADAVIIFVSKFTYIYGLWNKVGVFSLVCLAVGAVVGALLRPSAVCLVRIADSLGYKERFITAYEALSVDSPMPMQELVIEDALRCAGEKDFGKSFSVVPSKVFFNVLIAALALFAFAYFVPITPSEDMQRQEEMHDRLDKAVEDMKREVENSSLTQNQKSEINAELNDLKKELSKYDNNGDAVSSLMNTQAELKKIADESENEQLKALSERLRQNSATREMGDLLKNGNISEFTEALSELNAALENMSDEEISALGNALMQAAESEGLDADTKQLLAELGDTMQQELTEEQLARVSQGLNELSDRINELAAENEDIREAVKKLNSDLAEASEAVGGKPSSTAGQNAEGMPSEGGSSDGNIGEGASSQEGTGGSGSGAGKGSVENADIYTSKASNFGDYDAELDSNGEATGDTVQNRQDGGRGEMVPYRDVFNEYKDEALNSIESEDIPYGVKDIVRDYFSSLE